MRAVLLVFTVVQLTGTFKQLGGVRAEDKQAVLQAGIDDSMQYAWFGTRPKSPS